jgi:hypothetical protein
LGRSGQGTVAIVLFGPFRYFCGPIVTCDVQRDVLALIPAPYRFFA